MTGLPRAFDSLSVALAERYALERELGRGGMATVYLAEDLKLQRHVALKVLRPELAASLGNERFLREIAIAARLSHPHILPLHDSGEAGGHLYYAMPYVEGESLRDRLNREKQLPLDDTLQVAQEVADALNYAHSRGVIHRDIKPENILLDGDHALVADFGIARALDLAGERLTETGLALGTPAYMSPEQATGELIDGRSDIYALGCVVYEMLVGEPPYTGPSAAAIIARRLSEPLPSLRVVRDGVPPGVEQAIHKALARTAADRFRTVDQFTRALTAPPGPSRARLAISRRTLFIGGAAGLIVTSAFLLPGALRRWRATVDPAANVVAVLPLVPAGPDTTLERLGQNLVITLSTNLDGLGGMRAIDPLTVLAQARHTPSTSSTLGGALEIGRRLGASGVIRGALARDGSRVRIYLALYATADSAIVGQASVLGSPDSVARVTDAATWALLQQIWRARDPPTPSLASITTQSIPALRAFLDGERALSQDRWSVAEKAYARAIGEDSTFALALWRSAYARWWTGEETDSAALGAALAHLSELPEKDRALAEVWAARRESETAETLHRARALTERFSDYWPAWFEYADELFHFGPMLGYDLRLASQAFERVLELNPRLIPAWNHLLDAQIVLQDTAIVARCLTQLDSLDPLDANATPRESRRLRRWQIPLLRGSRFEGSAADSLVADIASVQNVYDQMWLVLQFNAIAGPAAQIELSRRVIARTPWRAASAIHRKGIALSWAARGAWDSAMAAIDDYASRASDLAGLTPAQVAASKAGPDLAKLDPYRFAVVGAWLGALEPSLAEARHETAAQTVSRMNSPWRKSELFWFDGLLAVSKRDLAALHQAQRELMNVDTAVAKAPLRSLAAFDLELQGRRREAADSMAALAWSPGGIDRPYWGINRLAGARWLEAEGDLEQAARLLPWWQAMIGNPDFVHAVIVLWGPSLMETARVEAARGNKELARENYQQFLRLYDMPSPRVRYLQDDARQALRNFENHDRH